MTTEDPKAVRGLAYWDQPRAFSFWQKVQIRIFSRLFAWIIAILGRTIRWQAEGDEHLKQIHDQGRRAIFVFWHGSILPATYYYRRRGIVVMISHNFDGEYIAQCIQRHGFGTARGSSSRGGLKALAELALHLRRGKDVGFAADGPRGPRHVAKPGPAMLAKKTGDAIFCFHITLRRKFQLNNWDGTQIPLPFTRACVLKAAPIYVPLDCDKAELETKIQEMQVALDQLRERGDRYWDRDPGANLDDNCGG